MIEKRKETNKIDAKVSSINEQEKMNQEKTDKVLNSLVSNEPKTKIIVDRNGRVRRVREAEKRKSMPVYIPESLYEKFNAINIAYGKSNNCAIVEMIREYVTEKKSLLDKL